MLLSHFSCSHSGFTDKNLPIPLGFGYSRRIGLKKVKNRRLNSEILTSQSSNIEPSSLDLQTVSVNIDQPLSLNNLTCIGGRFRCVNPYDYGLHKNILLTLAGVNKADLIEKQVSFAVGKTEIGLTDLSSRFVLVESTMPIESGEVDSQGKKLYLASPVFHIIFFDKNLMLSFADALSSDQLLSETMFFNNSLEYCLNRYNIPAEKLTPFERLSIAELVSDGRIDESEISSQEVLTSVTNSVLQEALFSEERESIKKSMEIRHFFKNYQARDSIKLPTYLKESIFENFRLSLYATRIFGVVAVSSDVDNFQSHKSLFVEQDKSQNVARALDRKTYKIPAKLQSKQNNLQLRLGETAYARSVVVYPSFLPSFQYRETRVEIQVANDAAQSVWLSLLTFQDSTTLDLLLAYQLDLFLKNVKIEKLLIPVVDYLESYPNLESAKGLILRSGKDNTKKALLKTASTLKTLLKNNNTRLETLEFFVDFTKTFVLYFLRDSMYNNLLNRLIIALNPLQITKNKQFVSAVTEAIESAGVDSLGMVSQNMDSSFRSVLLAILQNLASPSGEVKRGKRIEEYKVQFFLLNELLEKQFLRVGNYNAKTSANHLISNLNNELFKLENQYGDQVRETYMLLSYYTSGVVNFLRQQDNESTTVAASVRVLSLFSQKYPENVKIENRKVVIDNTKTNAEISLVSASVFYLKRFLSLPFELSMKKSYFSKYDKIVLEGIIQRYRNKEALIVVSDDKPNNTSEPNIEESLTD